MGQHQYETDLKTGIKLFGRCKFHGKCICGNCANAPINRKDNVISRKPDGTTIEFQASAVNETEIESGKTEAQVGAGFSRHISPGRGHSYPTCPKCGGRVWAGKNHPCKADKPRELPKPVDVSMPPQNEELASLTPTFDGVELPEPSTGKIINFKQKSKPGEFATFVGACRNGHKRTADNTYIRKNGRVECRDCRRAYQKLYKIKQIPRDENKPRTYTIIIENVSKLHLDTIMLHTTQTDIITVRPE